VCLVGTSAFVVGRRSFHVGQRPLAGRLERVILILQKAANIFSRRHMEIPFVYSD
jgi:hypothetical protein